MLLVRHSGALVRDLNLQTCFEPLLCCKRPVYLSCTCIALRPLSALAGLEFKKGVPARVYGELPEVVTPLAIG